MHLSGFDRFAWATSFVGEAVLLLVLFVRRRSGAFPIFTIYVVEQVAATAVLYLVFYHLSVHAYRYCFWSLSILDEVIQILVLYEIAFHVFCPTGVWARDVRMTFAGMTCASVAVAFLLTWLAHPAAPYPIQTFILRSNFFSAALMSELFVGMVVLSGTVGLPWKTHVARIAQGLGAYSLVCVGLGIISTFVGLSREIRTFADLSHLRSLAWIACEAYWIVMLWMEAPASRELPEGMRVQIYTLQRQVEHDLIRIRAWRRN